MRKQVQRLPAIVRRQHQQHWTRRTAVDSERERLKMVLRNPEADIATQRTAHTMIPHDHPRRPISPRIAYWDDLHGDPKRIGFAFGGVNPGRLHARGQLVETHTVNYSIGMSGTYLLYVSLRQPHTPWASHGAAICKPAGETSAGGVGGFVRGSGTDAWQVPGSRALFQPGSCLA